MLLFISLISNSNSSFLYTFGEVISTHGLDTTDSVSLAVSFKAWKFFNRCFTIPWKVGEAGVDQDFLFPVVGEKSLVDSSNEPFPESDESPLGGRAEQARSSSTICSACLRQLSESGDSGSSGRSACTSLEQIRPLEQCLATFLETTRLIRCSKNLGFPGAENRGMDNITNDQDISFTYK